MSSPYTELQLDALRELANIGSGDASMVLPDSQGLESANPRKYADVAVPEIVAEAGSADEELVAGERASEAVA